MLIYPWSCISKYFECDFYFIMWSMIYTYTQIPLESSRETSVRWPMLRYTQVGTWKSWSVLKNKQCTFLLLPNIFICHCLRKPSLVVGEVNALVVTRWLQMFHFQMWGEQGVGKCSLNEQSQWKVFCGQIRISCIISSENYLQSY